MIRVIIKGLTTSLQVSTHNCSVWHRPPLSTVKRLMAPTQVWATLVKCRLSPGHRRTRPGCLRSLTGLTGRSAASSVWTHLRQCNALLLAQGRRCDRSRNNHVPPCTSKWVRCLHAGLCPGVTAVKPGKVRKDTVDLHPSVRQPSPALLINLSGRKPGRAESQ